MNKPEIKRDEYFDWARNNWVEYAAWTDRSGYRLRFKVNGIGDFRVYSGSKILYQGENFSEAAKAFDKNRKCTCNPHDLVYYGCQCA